MYPLGFYLARYIDWWHLRVAKAPFLWLVGIIVAANVLQFSVIRLFGSSFAWVLLIVAVALVPGMWAALLGVSKKLNPSKETEDQKALAKKFIDEFANKWSK
ncbi:hypothetical protein [Ruegeria sp. MALMAid1280]|uniref:hypothetical protein n=1 Tax=Ruegeria sp. MALMAid1280 TaxID=3411634 RepID=UPI003BA13726